MKNYKKGFLFGLVGIALAVGLVLAACELGDYEGTEDGVKITITLQSGNKFEMKATYQGETTTTKGTYTLSGTDITLKPEGGDEIKGKLEGNKITIQGTTLTKKSVAGDAVLSPGDVIDVEFADDFDGE
ncbi:hypothetical protein FACS189483_08120 [Spirochaetia bacterium]|nr:hypothetical protein FACS189483_08120 [Spirochaetia bacterium]